MLLERGENRGGINTNDAAVCGDKEGVSGLHFIL